MKRERCSLKSSSVNKTTRHRPHFNLLLFSLLIYIRFYICFYSLLFVFLVILSFYCFYLNLIHLRFLLNQSCFESNVNQLRTDWLQWPNLAFMHRFLGNTLKLKIINKHIIYGLIMLIYENVLQNLCFEIQLWYNKKKDKKTKIT